MWNIYKNTQKAKAKLGVLLCVLCWGVFIGAGVAPAYGTVRIFACEPEWAALAAEIGGTHVNVFTATHGQQDPHHIRARPKLIAQIRKADVLVCTGVGLEIGWLPLLLAKAKGQVQPNAVGHLAVANLVPLLEKPTVLDRSLGDVHPEGNPHVHLQPHNILSIAAALSKRLQMVDGANATAYEALLAGFVQRWQAAIVKWEAAATPLRGQKVVVHHRSFSYLLAWLGVEQAATLEPKPGIPPTASHLQEVLQTLKALETQGVKPIATLRTPYDPAEASQWLEAKTATPALVLPYTIGGTKEATNLFTLFDETLAVLNNSLKNKNKKAFPDGL